MITLADCVVDGVRSVVVESHEAGAGGVVIVPDRSSYDLVRTILADGDDLEHALSNLLQAKGSARSNLNIERYYPPIKPPDDRDAIVTAFGNTHVRVNGKPSDFRELDWFYKGNGYTLVADGEPISLSSDGYGGGIEIEYALVFMISSRGLPEVVGYVLANDFSDVEMRHRHPNLANLSKLAQTGIGRQLAVAKDIPANLMVKCDILRGNGGEKWASQGESGQGAVRYSTQYLTNLIFSNSAINLVPFTVYYVLLGAVISSNKAGIELSHGDVISARSLNDGISISNRYQDEVVALACC